MPNMTVVLEALLRAATANNEPLELQICLRGNPNPIGPGKVEAFLPEDTDGIFRIVTDAIMQTQAGPKQLKLPILFAGDAVEWIAQPPLNGDNEPSIITPGGGRTRGGIHLG